MTWWVIANPAAGRRGDIVARTTRALDGAGVTGQINVSRTADHVAELIDAGAAAGFHRFAAVGGDGTLNLVVDAVMRRSWAVNPVIGVLPAGSGCDFIRTFGISQVMEEAAHHLAGDATYTVDVGHLSGPWGDRHFINAATFGLGAEVVRRAERMPARIGAARYKLAIWPTLVRFPRAEIEVATERRTFSGEAMMVVLANAQFFGGGMNVAPKAMLMDGELDVQVFSGPKRLAVILQPRLTRGTHLTHPAVHRMSSGKITITTDAAWPVEADGEYLGRGSVTATIRAQALTVKI